MKIYIDNGYNPVSAEAADILYETGLRLASALKPYEIETRLSYPENGAKQPAVNSNQSASHINEANDWGADYYIGLHINSSPDKFITGTGVAVYRSSPEIDGLAYFILERMASETRLQNRGVSARSDCLPLRKAKMPAAVVDIGYITNKNDCAVMSEQPELIAELIARGIAEGMSANDRTPAPPEPADTAQGDTPSFFQLYPAGKRDICRLTVNVYKENAPRKPVADANVTVYHGKDGKHTLVYRGVTNAAGATLPIELPCYSDRFCKTPEMFCICVRHHCYMPKNQWIYIRNERTLRQTIDLTERKITGRRN
ncbi:MAG: N-acetylmuramoyl-L-alanine amidase [Eubacteriales bacterium]|nr:N-acetylmuramoyl-L-alanine amidase [Eubacteriales bacterium]